MAITKVQQKLGEAHSTTSVTVTLDATATAGNLLVAVCQYRGDRTLTTPSGWSLAKDQQHSASDTTHPDCSVFYKVSDGTEAATLFTISNTGNVAAWVAEYSPIASTTWTTPLDQTNGASNSAATTVGSGSITTTAADELVVVGYAWNEATNTLLPASRSYTNSYTEQGYLNNGTNNAVGAATNILTATATTSTAASWTNNDNVSVVIASFKVTAASTGSYQPGFRFAFI